MRGVSRRGFLAISLLAGQLLAGCSAVDSRDESPRDNSSANDSAIEGDEQSEEVIDEPKTALVGEPVTYEASGGGEFCITVDALERSQEATDYDNSIEDISEGYSDCYLLLTIENVSVDTNDSPYTSLARSWLEDSAGVTVNPLNSGFSYGEYGAAPGYSFEIFEGQTIRIAVPYHLPDSETEYSVVIGDVRVPVSKTEGTRHIG